VCSSMRSGCVPPCHVSVGASRLVTGERLPRKDAIWPLTREACRIVTPAFLAPNKSPNKSRVFPNFPAELN
jgi:hypothetical protein